MSVAQIRITDSKNPMISDYRVKRNEIQVKREKIRLR